MKLLDTGLIIVVIFFGMVMLASYFSKDVLKPSSEATKESESVNEKGEKEKSRYRK